MAFPSGTTVPTTHLDSSTDSPALARADLLTAVEAVNDIIASENAANGVVVLNGSAELPTALLPQTVTKASFSIEPSNRIVQIIDCLRLPAKNLADVADDLPSPQVGDLIALLDGDAGSPCLAMWNGTNWKVIQLGATASSS